jgi:hypothetical protein
MSKAKKPSREDLEEEIVSLALTVRYLMDDVEYLLDHKGEERVENIRHYVGELRQFFNKAE